MGISSRFSNVGLWIQHDWIPIKPTDFTLDLHSWKRVVLFRKHLVLLLGSALQATQLRDVQRWRTLLFYHRETLMRFSFPLHLWNFLEIEKNRTLLMGASITCRKYVPSQKIVFLSDKQKKNAFIVFHQPGDWMDTWWNALPIDACSFLKANRNL